MKIYREKIIVIFTIVFLILLSACDDPAEESHIKLENQSQENHTTQDSNANSSNDDATKHVTNDNNTNTDTVDTSNNDINEKVETSNNPKEENKSDPNIAASLKEDYLRKLNETKKEMDEAQKKSEGEITYALKKVEGDRYDVWDGLLNEVYGVLQEQLSTEEMNQLREEQRNWIDYRDNTAKEASLKYKGGTMEHLEYVTVLADLTEERCYELVEDYMK
ncbi:lysozyme inhibitor LprI family protein [Piscibacillus halophilus]|uniref:lysozyme inhibitor LprI family protein n=1 Tax=Piscibacillus halophilus TaxID=571933 RepID=UPI00158B7B63|nr:lysozyme inhibitor LprI family protein [Piscibacillus halophilus]